MFDKRCRADVERGLEPVGSSLERVGVSANQLTAAGLVISAVAAAVVAQGWLIAGAVLLAFSAVPDLLDGAVAKASGTASPRGAFFDSVADRVSDTLVLGGVAWYLASSHSAHAAVLALAVVGASNLVSYERARAESLGFTARGGLMERAERMIAVGIGLILRVVLVPVLWLMLGLTVFTAVQRFVMVWRQGPSGPLSGKQGTPRRDPGETLLARWRARRPATGFRPGGERAVGLWRAGRTGDARSRVARDRSRTRP
ncbi:MAG: CDP-alcohol phosphatidyltransferase family protein [Acidimicrobiales bacterium]